MYSDVARLRRRRAKKPVPAARYTLSLRQHSAWSGPLGHHGGFVEDPTMRRLLAAAILAGLTYYHVARALELTAVQSQSRPTFALQYYP
jgi:hypothetical protein